MIPNRNDNSSVAIKIGTRKLGCSFRVDTDRIRRTCPKSFASIRITIVDCKDRYFKDSSMRVSYESYFLTIFIVSSIDLAIFDGWEW